jgi:hypothetical protein
VKRTDCWNALYMYAQAHSFSHARACLHKLKSFTCLFYFVLFFIYLFFFCSVTFHTLLYFTQICFVTVLRSQKKKSRGWWKLLYLRLPLSYVLLYTSSSLWPKPTSWKFLSVAKVMTWLSLPSFLWTEWLGNWKGL